MPRLLILDVVRLLKSFQPAKLRPCRVGSDLSKKRGDCFNDVRITQAVESVLPDSFAFRDFRINGVHISLLLQRHVETRIKERNILYTLQLLQTRSHNQQRRIIMSSPNQPRIHEGHTMEPSHLMHLDDAVHLH
jgi:hypothetical protein